MLFSKKLIQIICLLWVLNSHAQQEQTLHFLRDIWQVGLTNPALIPPEYKVNVAIPSFYINYNAPITVNDMIVKTGIRRTLTPLTPQYLDKLSDYNYADGNFQFQAGAISFPINKRVFLSLHQSINGNFYGEFDKNALTILHQGNSAFVGKTAVFDNKIVGSVYNELSAAIVYKVNNVSVGFRIKGLNGMWGAFSNGNKIKLTTDKNIYNLQIDNDYELQTFDPPVTGLGYLGRNGGYTADIGIAYKMQRLAIAASVNNLGYGIHWMHGGMSYTSRGQGDFTGFEKFDINKNTYSDIFNTLKKSMNFTQTIRGDLIQSLPVQMYLSGIYTVHPKIEIGGLFYMEQSPIETKFGLTLNGTTKLIKGLNLGVSYNLRNENQKTVGFHATALLFKTLQFYIVTDNIDFIIKPLDSRTFNGRIGMNITFGENDILPKLKKQHQKKQKLNGTERSTRQYF